MSKKKSPGVKAKRNYRDTIFRMAFKEKKMSYPDGIYGYIEGENAKQLAIALKMKAEEMSYELINRLTDASIEEVEAL